MTKRVFNFNPGPAVLPEQVLEEAQKDLLSLPNVGMSVLEISHRSSTFENILNDTINNIRKLANIPENYKILFLGGGASLQFSMVPLNLMPPINKADYIVTGSWSKKAVKEAKRVGAVNIAGTTESENFVRVPDQSELKLDSTAAYVHFTSNETIHGVEYFAEPQVGNVPLVCDMSSDIFSRKIDITKYALIYAGAQKNLGPAGVTLVIIRDDMVERSQDSLHTMLNYKTQVENNSLYNTPPVFGVYIVGLVMKWLLNLGGLEAIEKTNREKAKYIYDVIDESDGFYKGHAKKEFRSLMNITFRLPSEELEKKLIKETTEAGFIGLKGHRSVGGLRASVYNAFPIEGAIKLAEFMREFRKKN
ncbi:MAG: phosphoserine transaminase [Ignavibacteria bacterium]|nr:phosphoserine transaminase [Ignavibacteria bacterium]